jgi:hypothetical protein
MTAINCLECGRPNSPDARVCIWCGVPVIRANQPLNFEPLKAEVEYLDGLERLDGPANVNIIVSPSGVEVSEQMPGTRSILLPVESLISARATGPLRSVGGKPRPSPSGWLRLNAPAPGEEKVRSALTLKYEMDGEMRELVLERNDSGGADVLRRMARTIESLMRSRTPA